MYKSDHSRIEIFENGRFEIRIKNADLVAIPNDERGFVRLMIDSIDAQVGVELLCNRNSCYIDEENHDLPGHPRQSCRSRKYHHDFVQSLFGIGKK